MNRATRRIEPDAGLPPSSASTAAEQGPRGASRWGSPGDRVVVLAYHDVQDVDRFRQQADYIRANFRPVSVEAVVDAQHGRARLPKRALLVTFDDGDRSVYEHALPILGERGIPAVVFVIPELIGTDQPFWWREARELVRRGATIDGRAPGSPDDAVRAMKQVPDEERRRRLHELRHDQGEVISQRQLTALELCTLEAGGIAVGNHTYSHPCLDRCGPESVIAELTRAHETLAGWLGHAPRVFAYPNGNADVRAEAVLDQLGYAAAFLFDHRISHLPAANPFRISRVRVNSTTTMTRFRHILSGFHPLVHHALGRS